jgi:hypothetical protein
MNDTLRQGHFSSYSWPMSEERVQYKFMIPATLKAALENAAEVNRRSLSAEIIDRLENSVQSDEHYSPKERLRRRREMLNIEMDIMQARIAELHRKLSELSADDSTPDDTPSPNIRKRIRPAKDDPTSD